MAWRAWASRAFRVLPKRASAGQKGVTFVGILFGVAVGTGAALFAEPIVEWFRVAEKAEDSYDGIRYVAIMHYAVAFTLTVTSFIGYYTSENVPRLQIRFFNAAFLQFILDVSMVISYFLLFFFAEGPTAGPTEGPSARPEVVFVVFAFLLYVLWDLLGWRVKRDPLSQLALGYTPIGRDKRWKSYGYRRRTTLVCFGISLGLWAYVEWRGDMGNSGVVVVDWILIALILGFRLFKTFGDAGIEYVGQPDEDKPASGYKDYREVAFHDWKRVVPSAVAHNIDFLRSIGNAPAGLEIGTPAEHVAADHLVAAGAIKMGLTENPAASIVTLTKSGKAFVQFCPDRPDVGSVGDPTIDGDPTVGGVEA